MHAVLIRHFGGPEAVELADIPVPVPSDGELLLKVEAASLNPVDWKIRSGRYPVVKEDKLPFVLGRDFSATVLQSDDAALPAGTLVHGMVDMKHGALAQYTIARPEQVVPVPGALDRMAAAAVPLAALTAWQGLFVQGGLRAGQRVLIHAGAGGVGHFAVQFAKARGAHVITTVSTDDVELARNLGADEVVDHVQERFETKTRDIDLVFDLIGGEVQERSWAVLRRGGTLVSTVGQPPKERADAIGVRAVGYQAGPDAGQLREIDALIQAGKVRPVVSRKYALGDAKEALRALEDGHVTGKLVLDLRGAVADVPDPIYWPGA
ncbi:MAG: NADP-dependent oxidoreductase [Burkholderiales bacterium]|nr:NADP-dependent oxidoreductase [Burkholderiales bacterium]